MKTYIALLRGINVSGKNSLKMVDLKQLFMDLKFHNVLTYIQSGNVLFQSNKTDCRNIEIQITKAIAQQFNYSINVLVINKQTLEAIFQQNPFKQRPAIDISKLHVTLLNNQPDSKNITQLENLQLTNNDEYQILGKSIYLYCPNGYGKTKLTNNFFEKKIKTSATTRNWKTITKLLELSNQTIE